MPAGAARRPASPANGCLLGPLLRGGAWSRSPRHRLRDRRRSRRDGLLPRRVRGAAAPDAPPRAVPERAPATRRHGRRARGGGGRASLDHDPTAARPCFQRAVALVERRGRPAGALVRGAAPRPPLPRPPRRPRPDLAAGPHAERRGPMAHGGPARTAASNLFSACSAGERPRILAGLDAEQRTAAVELLGRQGAPETAAALAFCALHGANPDTFFAWQPYLVPGRGWG